MEPEFWSRLRRSRFVGVLAVYLGASWLVLQVANELREALDLPAWISPVTVILLLVGLLVVLATAWVQSHPAVGQRAERKEVPGSWELDLGEAASSIRRGRLPHLTWSRAILVGVFAFSLLFGFAGIYVLSMDRGRTLAPEPPLAGEAAPGIAVLPFDVRGPGAEVWNEGMVDVLSKSLDGAAGLRTIDSRTVLARWREGVADAEVPDAATALQVARRTGARYAILGSVVAAADRLRMVADVYDLQTGRGLDEAQVDGAADSVFDVVDRFSGEVLRAMVGEHSEIPELDLARATTTSLPALKAYLEGEMLLRQGGFDEAIRAYGSAVAADSAFALAWLRLSIAYGWAPRPEFELGEEAAVRAARLADRLPERDALLARGSYEFGRGSPEGLETLRTAARKYPDDALAWFLLADFLFHQGGSLLADPAESRRGFARAIELDPTFAPAYIHEIHVTLRTDPDSARVAGLIDTYRRLAPGTPSAREFDLVQAIAFGTDSTRATAMAVVDTISEFFLPFIAHANLGHPRFLDQKLALYAVARNRPNPFEAHLGASYLALARFHRGEIDAAHEAAGDARVGTAEGRILFLADAAGLPVPEERLEQALAENRTADPTVPWEPTGGGYFLWGAWALEGGRHDEYDQARAELRAIADEAIADADSLVANSAEGMARGLEGFAAWRDGRPEEAARVLDEARLQTAGGADSSTPNRIIRWWLAELALEAGELERAAVLFQSLAHGESFTADPMAVLRLARVQEELGRLDEARANYDWFALAWRDADPAMRELVEEARRATTRLAGS